MSYCIILTTFSSETGAENLAAALVENKLAACVQIHPVTSFYTWEGQAQKHPEFRLIIKTTQAVYRKAKRFIRDHHDYDVPQIVRIAIEDGLSEYLSWIGNATESPEP